MKIKRVILLGDSSKPNVQVVWRQVNSILKRSGFEIVSADKSARADIALVIGGDGMVLKSARLLYGKDIPVLGINTGQMGFLSEVSVYEMKNLKECLKKGRILLEKRDTLQCRIKRDKKQIFAGYAINDVVIKAESAVRVIDLSLKIDSSPVANYVVDGLIVSTPTGSTAYSLAAGGPIVEPSSRVFLVTPVSPHSLNLRPLVISNKRELTAVVRKNHSRIVLALDGQKHFPVQVGDVIVITRAARPVIIAHTGRYDFYNRLKEKFGWSQRG